jgi:hypothetical protein
MSSVLPGLSEFRAFTSGRVAGVIGRGDDHLAVAFWAPEGPADGYRPGVVYIGDDVGRVISVLRPWEYRY